MYTKIPCPMKLTDEELKAHVLDGEYWNENADFWDLLQEFMRRDERAANENYEHALEIFAQFRDLGLQSLSGEEWSGFEGTTHWAMRKSE